MVETPQTAALTLAVAAIGVQVSPREAPLKPAPTVSARCDSKVFAHREHGNTNGPQRTLSGSATRRKEQVQKEGRHQERVRLDIPQAIVDDGEISSCRGPGTDGPSDQ